MTLRAALAIAAGLALVVLPPPVVAAAAGAAGLPQAPAAPLANDEVPVPAGSAVVPLSPETPLRLALTLGFANPARLDSFLAAVENPRSGEYRKFLSFAEFEREFGSSSRSASTVVGALRANGATSVTVAPGGFAVDGTLTAAGVARLFGVQLVRYQSPTGAGGYTAVGPPRLPSPLAGLVSGLDGLAAHGFAPPTAATLDEVTPPSPVVHLPGAFVQGNASDGADWFLGTDYAQVYGATDLLPGNQSVPNATYPRGVAIATLLASGYDAANSTVLPPWTWSVVDDYFNDTFPAGWPHPNLQGIPVNETGAPPPPLPHPYPGEPDTTGFDVENSLDLEMAGSLAPGASLYNFYFSGALAADPSTAGFLPQYLADDLGAALNYDYGPAHLAVVSCSFGLDDLVDAQWDAELATAAAMGVTVVAASGDQGDAPSALTGRGDNQWPLWPSTATFDAYGAVSVGGVSLVLAGVPSGRYTAPPLVVQYDPNVTGFASVSAWWDTSGGIGAFAGTEGGTSEIYAEPTWQFHSAAQPPIVSATELEGFGKLGRAGPDVAFPANSTIAFVSAAANGTPYFSVLGGTSVAAPVFGGLLADVVAVENASTPGGVRGLGFIDPGLYRTASYYAAHPGPNDPFLPVVSGGNAQFSAGAGWNPTTGWGGLYGPRLLVADANPTVVDYVYLGPTPTLPVGAPILTPVEVVALLVGATAVVVAAGIVLSGRRRRRPRGTRPLPPYASVAPRGPAAPTSLGPYATFACPFCGAERPAEPGRCPSCGAM
jgi:subtilase family serine protease